MDPGSTLTAPPLDTTAEVETPEHVRFQHRIAGPARRSLAYLVDLLVRTAILLVVGLVLALAGLGAGELEGVSNGLMLVAYFGIEWGYFAFFETIWSGRTPGKRALRVRVVREGGQALRLVDSLLRNLLRAADFLPMLYAVGLVTMGRDSRFRRLGNLVAGTLVVVEERDWLGAPLTISPAPTPAELEVLPARPDLSPSELEAIELFLRRSGRLSPMREHELAAIVAPVFAERMDVTFQDPSRFLALLLHRARGRAATPGVRTPSPSPFGGP